MVLGGQKLLGFIFPILMVAAVSGCKFQRAETAALAKMQLVGMSSEQILTCMGNPVAANMIGETEVWTFLSGGDYVGSGSVTTYANGASAGSTTVVSTSSIRRSCKIDLVFRDQRVTKVNYSGRTGGLITRGEQCAFAVENCVSQ